MKARLWRLGMVPVAAIWLGGCQLLPIKTIGQSSPAPTPTSTPAETTVLKKEERIVIGGSQGHSKAFEVKAGERVFFQNDSSQKVTLTINLAQPVKIELEPQAVFGLQIPVGASQIGFDWGGGGGSLVVQP